MSEKTERLDTVNGPAPRLQRPASRILIITHDPLRENLSGPGIRALEVARALSESHPVTVATPFSPQIVDHRCTFAQYSFGRPETMRGLADQADVIIVQGFTLTRFPFLATFGATIVVDLYCPFSIEHLEFVTSRSSVARALASTVEDGLSRQDVHSIAETPVVLDALNTQLKRGDFFICASERQRDFWIGALHATGRINPWTYANDPTLRSLIDVVPFGLPDGRPARSDRGGKDGARPANAMKGVHSGIAVDDYVLLWAGSILDWQDPQTLVRAVGSLARRRPDIKLFFMGTRHPNPQIPVMRAVQESMTIARELAVLDTHIFFNDWVAYDDRWRYLMEADVGLSTHRDHLETHLSFRTRMLDYVWSGLPIICTKGDTFADLVADRRLGVVVPPGDVDALAAAITRLVDNKDERAACRERLLELAEEFRWHRVVAPLARFCNGPRFAADRDPDRRSQRRRLARRSFLTKWLRSVAARLGLSRSRLDRVKALWLGTEEKSL